MAEPNPWAEEAQDLVGDDFIHSSDLPKLKRRFVPTRGGQLLKEVRHGKDLRPSTS